MWHPSDNNKNDPNVRKKVVIPALPFYLNDIFLHDELRGKGILVGILSRHCNGLPGPWALWLVTQQCKSDSYIVFISKCVVMPPS